jgi:hypothetical protein
LKNFHPLAHSEFGNHPLPSDSLEIEAALRAGQISWDICAYYDLRYGERGRRFTRSDSGYLIALTHQDVLSVQEQVKWLAGILASRGMPTFLLERHLRILHRELCAALPENSSQYENLLAAAETMTQRRTAQISESTALELAADFQQQVSNDEWAQRLPDAGMLLIAAVADEANHFKHVVSSLLAWLADSERFSAQWRVAIETTLLKAREAVRHD